MQTLRHKDSVPNPIRKASCGTLANASRIVVDPSRIFTFTCLLFSAARHWITTFPHLKTSIWTLYRFRSKPQYLKQRLSSYILLHSAWFFFFLDIVNVQCSFRLSYLACLLSFIFMSECKVARKELFRELIIVTFCNFSAAFSTQINLKRCNSRQIANRVIATLKINQKAVRAKCTYT